MKVTVDKMRSEKMGIEVANVSVILDPSSKSLRLHGMMLPTTSYQFDNTNVEPDILCSFQDEQGRVIYSIPAHEFISFNLNKYGVFALEIASEIIKIDSIAEIRLLPFFSSKTDCLLYSDQTKQTKPNI